MQQIVATDFNPLKDIPLRVSLPSDALKEMHDRMD